MSTLKPVIVPDSNPPDDNDIPDGKLLPAASAYDVASVAANCIDIAISAAPSNEAPVVHDGVELKVTAFTLIAVPPSELTR